MKKTCLMMLASLALNFNAEAAGTKYFCKELTDYSKKTLVITQVGEEEVSDGDSERFIVELFEIGNKTPILVKKGKVEVEDVMFEFKSDDKKVRVMIYMDEMGEAYLTVGRKKTKYNCD